jgi:hypothetical protein
MRGYALADEDQRLISARLECAREGQERLDVTLTGRGGEEDSH